MERGQSIELWKEFQKQADYDFHISNMLIESYFGSAAYHLQQCVEKYVKAVILQNFPDGNMKKYGHMPLIEISHKLQKLMDIEIKSLNNPNIDELWQNNYEIFNELIELFRQLQTKKFKQIVWKESLQIKLTKEENDEIVSLFRTPYEEIRFAFNNLGTYIKVKCHIRKNSNLDILRYHHDQLSGINWQNESDKVLDNIRSLLKKIDSNAVDKSSNITELFLFLQVLIYSNSTLHILPHETIGRYPCEIDDKSSLELYEDHRYALTKLSERVETDRKKLGSLLRLKKSSV